MGTKVRPAEIRPLEITKRRLEISSAFLDGPTHTVVVSNATFSPVEPSSSSSRGFPSPVSSPQPLSPNERVAYLPSREQLAQRLGKSTSTLNVAQSPPPVLNSWDEEQSDANMRSTGPLSNSSFNSTSYRPTRAQLAERLAGQKKGFGSSVPPRAPPPASGSKAKQPNSVSFSQSHPPSAFNASSLRPKHSYTRSLGTGPSTSSFASTSSLSQQEPRSLSMAIKSSSTLHSHSPSINSSMSVSEFGTRGNLKKSNSTASTSSRFARSVTSLLSRKPKDKDNMPSPTRTSQYSVSSGSQATSPGPKTPSSPAWVKVDEPDYTTMSTPSPTAPMKRSVFQRVTGAKVADYSFAGPSYFERNPEVHQKVQVQAQDWAREGLERERAALAAKSKIQPSSQKSILPDVGPKSKVKTPTVGIKASRAKDVSTKDTNGAAKPELKSILPSVKPSSTVLRKKEKAVPVPVPVRRFVSGSRKD